jgi:paraquat-inducible protein B
MGGHVVRTPVRLGRADGSIVVFQPGDELTDVTDDERQQLVAAGSVVSVTTQKKLDQLQKDREKAREAIAKAEAELAAATALEGELLLEEEAVAQKAAAEGSTGSEAVVAPKPTAATVEAKATETKAETKTADTKADAKAKAQSSGKEFK